MKLEDVGSIVNIIGIVANIIMAFATIIAVWVAYTQIKKNRLQQIEAVARDHYQNYLQLCIQYPEFTLLQDHQIDFAKKTFDGSAEKFRQYDWFFWNGMNALESLFFSIGGRESWRATIASVLDDHEQMLASELVSNYANTFEPEFREFLSKWLARGRATPVQSAIPS